MPVKLVIEGGRPLRGEVATSAAKNAALPALAAALLTAEPVILENVPALADVRTMRALLERLGGETADLADGSTRIRVPQVTSPEAPYDLVSTMRASVLVLGPLVARAGVARVALPGGCAIGVRPIDQHLKGLALLGAEIAIENGYVVSMDDAIGELEEGSVLVEGWVDKPGSYPVTRGLTVSGAIVAARAVPRLAVKMIPQHVRVRESFRGHCNIVRTYA